MKQCAKECRKCDKACREILKHTGNESGYSVRSWLKKILAEVDWDIFRNSDRNQ